ncbi:hypothetical protein M0812_22674 [Anaeramoeba flamelloides]|uniref:Uncharacterized protein n=1 Tax=Anaeramoeba flamelloides TaxID=1746091 RepID=A0AAV7YVD9_9EUKA|nr:hypothetical protein M0812_22674 [Anaeramoeba flamelloides]
MTEITQLTRVENLPDFEDLKQRFASFKNYNDRFTELLKIYPSSFYGIKPFHLKKEWIKSFKKGFVDKSELGEIRIYRDSIVDLSMLVGKKQRTIERGMTMFFKRSYNYENINPYGKDWFIFGEVSKDCNLTFRCKKKKYAEKMKKINSKVTNRKKEKEKVNMKEKEKEKVKVKVKVKAKEKKKSGGKEEKEQEKKVKGKEQKKIKKIRIEKKVIRLQKKNFPKNKSFDKFTQKKDTPKTTHLFEKKTIVQMQSNFTQQTLLHKKSKLKPKARFAETNLNLLEKMVQEIESTPQTPTSQEHLGNPKKRKLITKQSPEKEQLCEQFTNIKRSNSPLFNVLETNDYTNILTSPKNVLRFDHFYEQTFPYFLETNNDLIDENWFDDFFQQYLD